MRMSVKALALTSGAIWGGCMLTCGLINLAAPRYARRFLEMMSSVYPGFHNSGTVPDVLTGAGYGFVDGAAGGALVAVLYNRLTCCEKVAESTEIAEPVEPAA